MTDYFRPRLRVDEVQLADVDDFAEIHRLAFHRGWDAAELEALVHQPGVIALVARRTPFLGRTAPVGFLVLRAAADEAEVLTLVVHPDCRGRGLGRMLMDEGLRRLYADRIRSVFLEVEAGNVAALQLYRRLGFQQVGTRPGYYAQGGGPPVEARVLRLDLR